MKKFKYRVESFLKFLTHQRDSALKELNSAEAYRNQWVTEYREREEKIKNCYRNNSEIGQQGRDVHFINDNNHYLKMLKVQMENILFEIQKAEEEFQEKYKKFLDIELRVKKLEKHKEKEFEKFLKEYKKKSQKLSDEINATRKRG